MTDYSDPWWGHISGKCIDDCPWCHINELKAELAELRDAIKPRECAKCQGTGQYSYPSSDGYCDCPACNGKGY